MIVFAAGNKYRVDVEPRWSEFHQTFYATGFKLIKSKNEFSKTARIWNIGPHFERVEG